MTLAHYLNPARFSNMSGKMAAIVGCIVGEKFTNPAIRKLYRTSDGFILAEHEGDVGANHFIGTMSDLERNWVTLLNAANMPHPLRMAAEIKFAGAFAP
jgi:hypothetical protein